MSSVFVLAALGYRKYKATSHVPRRRLPTARLCSPAPPPAWVALAVLLFFQVPSAFAVPIAQWGGPWQVTLDFSLTSVGDDEFFADISIDFDRAFRLEGSPSGQWEVTLVTFLSGQLQAGGTSNPKAMVDAFVTIATLSDPATPLFSVGFHHDVTDGNLIISSDPGSGSKQGFLNDGTYLVHGSLGVNTKVSEERFFDTGFAEADFFSFPGSNIGLVAIVSVVPRQAPVPEPSTLVLLGIGASALGGVLWRRRKKAW